MPYIVKIKPRRYFSLKGGIGDGWQGQVFWKRDRAPASLTNIFETKGKASQQAGRLRKQYQDYYNRTGERWEVGERRKKYRSERAEIRKSAKQSVLRQFGPSLWEMTIGIYDADLVAKIKSTIKERQAAGEARQDARYRQSYGRTY